MWPHLQPHKFMTAAVLIAQPKYNWVMRNKFIVHWPCLKITALDVCVLQIINKIEHAHTPICAKCSFLAGVWSERAGMCQAIKYLYATVFRETVKGGPWVCLCLDGVRQQGNVKSPDVHKALLYHPSLSWAAGQLQSQVLLKPKSLPVSAPVCGMSLCWSLLQAELENSNFHSCDVCNTNKRNF